MAKEYNEADLERVIAETTKHGAIHCLLYFDAHGREEEQVKNSLIEFIDRLANEKGVLYCKGEILAPYKRVTDETGIVADESAENKLVSYSTSAEVTALVEDFAKLAELTMRYGPVGVEILNPPEIRLPLSEAHTLLLDISTQAQQYSAYILKNVMKPEEYAEFEEKLKRRAEIGKQLADKKKE